MKNISFFEKLTIPDYDDPTQVCGGEVRVDSEKCTGCKLCFNSCPADALTYENKQSKMKMSGINECILCCACIAICPENAITAVRASKYSGFFKTIDRGEMVAPRF